MFKLYLYRRGRGQREKAEMCRKEWKKKNAANTLEIKDAKGAKLHEIGGEIASRKMGQLLGITFLQHS